MNQEELENRLLLDGATFVGYSNISDIKENRGYCGALTIGIKLLNSVVSEIKAHQAPTYEYFHHYRTVNAALDRLALFAALSLERDGQRVLMIPASQSSNEDPYRGAFPHKTAAVKANLGFIGKSGLFIHKDFGSMVRLATVLTEQPFDCPLPPVTLSCGACTACFDACPAHAIVGAEYVVGMPRETIFDAQKCSQYMKNAYQHIGRGAVCGLCIAACPYNNFDNINKS